MLDPGPGLYGSRLQSPGPVIKKNQADIKIIAHATATPELRQTSFGSENLPLDSENLPLW